MASFAEQRKAFEERIKVNYTPKANVQSSKKSQFNSNANGQGSASSRGLNKMGGRGNENPSKSNGKDKGMSR